MISHMVSDLDSQTWSQPWPGSGTRYRHTARFDLSDSPIWPISISNTVFQYFRFFMILWNFSELFLQNLQNRCQSASLTDSQIFSFQMELNFQKQLSHYFLESFFLFKYIFLRFFRIYEKSTGFGVDRYRRKIPEFLIWNLH